MSISITSPVTGAAQTGFTSPTYTLVVDNPPVGAAKSYAVTGLGGTQAGVTFHSIARPFTITWFPPKSLQTLGPADNNGVVKSFPKNVHQLLTRAGVLPLSGQPNQLAFVRTKLEIPAGADTADAAQIRAAISAHIGALWQIAAGIGDTSINGVV